MAFTFNNTSRFPDNISYGSAGGPGFKTFIFEGHSGVEQRNAAWSIARGRWNVAYGVRDKEDMDTVRAFFHAHRGRLIGFRFKDWGDYELVNENIGTGDGAEDTFQCIKTYSIGPGANDYVRTIYKLATGTVSVTVNAVAVPVGAGTTQVAVDYDTGVLTFGSGAVPGAGHVIRVTGEFDVPVRFDTDNMSSSHAGYLTEDWGDIPIVEILE